MTKRVDLSIAEAYAKKLVDMADIKAPSYDSDRLNNMVMQLPFAEAHMVLEGKTARALPVIGEDVVLSAYIMERFLRFIHDESGEAYDLTRPFRIRRRRLEALDGWDDWNTLVAFLQTHGLEPYVMFRNTPIERHNEEPCYVGDLRITFLDGFTYLGGAGG